MAEFQSKALTFQGGPDGNSPDFTFHIKRQHLEIHKVHFDEIRKTSGIAKKTGQRRTSNYEVSNFPFDHFPLNHRQMDPGIFAVSLGQSESHQRVLSQRKDPQNET